MKNNLKILKIRDWVIRYREPEGQGPHPVIWLFHGWMGDEDSMWVFASMIPEEHMILAPRGLYPTDEGGFSWCPVLAKGWPSIRAFTPAIQQLFDLMDHWPLEIPWANFEKFRLAGFSQGAALAYAITLCHPRRVKAVAGLAGFLPEDSGSYLPNDALINTPIYISHGIRDNLVPINKAREAVSLFDQSGALVTFCESDAGHKLGKDCFKGLEVFFKD